MMNFFQIDSECCTDTPRISTDTTRTGTVTHTTVPAVLQQVPLTHYLYLTPRASTPP